MREMELLDSDLCGVPCLRVTGEVDHESAPTLDRSIDRLLGSDGAHVFLDLAECPYVDSGGLSVLLLTLRRVQAKGGWMGVVAPGEDLRRLFEIAGLRAAPGFLIFATPEEAVAGVGT
jgi:anti-anti-sigma factor